MTIDYRPAETADFKRILELNESAIPAVNRIALADLEHLHNEAMALIVACSGPEVAGFLLALPETADYGSPNFRYFKRHYDAFAYVDRIVVGSAFRRQGIGAGLYAQLFASASGAPVTCEVNVEPPTPESILFHEQLGFQVVDHQNTDPGKRVALMIRFEP